MIEGSLSRRYTRAIFQLAREAGQEEKVGQEIEQFYTAYSSSELQGVLTNPTFGLDSRKNVLVQIVEVQQLSPLTGHFLSLQPGMLNRLRELLGGISSREVVLQQETDPGLIGGLLVELEGTIYDGSVRTQLEKMKQRIARGY